MRAERREETATALRERLRSAEAEIEIPDGLWERVREPRPDITPGVERRRTGGAFGSRGLFGPFGMRGRPLPVSVVVIAAAAVVFVLCGTWLLLSPAGSGGETAAEGRSAAVTIRVHNVEKPCRELRTLECALRVAKNPYDLYAAPTNSAGRTFHGDRLTAICVVTDGQLVTDEKGVSSTRWYRVEKTSGEGRHFEGWLPGVRTRNTKEVRLCESSEKPSS
jgi:hypothetical protein